MKIKTRLKMIPVVSYAANPMLQKEVPKTPRFTEQNCLPSNYRMRIEAEKLWSSGACGTPSPLGPPKELMPHLAGYSSLGPVVQGAVSQNFHLFGLHP
jgi:hypothetical protein